MNTFKKPFKWGTLSHYISIYGASKYNVHCVCMAACTKLYIWYGGIVLQIPQCDERLMGIEVTDSISRVPRSLEEYGHWKGIGTT